MLDHPPGTPYAHASRHDQLRPRVAAMQRNLKERLPPDAHRPAGVVSREIVADLRQEALRVISGEPVGNRLRSLTLPRGASYRQLLDLTDEIAATLDAFHRAYSDAFANGSVAWRYKRRR